VKQARHGHLSSADAKALAGSVGFDLIGAVESSLTVALRGGAKYAEGNNPLAIFRAALRNSIYGIEADKHGRSELLQRFLRDGPYEHEGSIPVALRGKRLTPQETDLAIRFIYSSMVNRFQGAVTELLAAGACHRLLRDPRLAAKLPPSIRLYVGDAVMAPRKTGKGVLKCADLHLLAENKPGNHVTLAGVVEVKSGPKSERDMAEQIEKHIRRAASGLVVGGRAYAASQICRGFGPGGRILRITVQPSDWPLPRTLRWERTGKTRRLVLDPPVPPIRDNELIPEGDDRWHISLRWSKEAVAAAAYEMTFWYMEKVGEVIYSVPGVKPKDWSEMSAAEVGRNAIKMMLYYAIRPDAIIAEEAREQKRPVPRPVANRLNRAIALYNTYGFGYALGMNFRNKEGRREMLWPKDLDELAQHAE
jgi:hypothetical protein